MTEAVEGVLADVALFLRQCEWNDCASEDKALALRNRLDAVVDAVRVAAPADAPRWTAEEVERVAANVDTISFNDVCDGFDVSGSEIVSMLRAYAHSLAAAPSGGARQEKPQEPSVTLTKQDVENLRADCLGTYAGGHHSDGHLEAFQHGMETVCNHLGSWIPTPTPQPKESK